MSDIEGASVMQVWPVSRQAALQGLYLGENLLAISRQIGRSVVFADYLTDSNGVIAVADKPGHFRVPPGLKNPSDWGLFQELMAQADVVISSGAYFKRLASVGNAPQEILRQFEAGHAYERLGQWRLDAGYARRSPHLAVVSRRLDFTLPDGLLAHGRRVTVFTIDRMANSLEAEALRERGARVVASGAQGVDGGSLVDALANEMGYRVIMMASGPAILEILLVANRLDILYVTRAAKEIPVDDPARAQRMLPRGETMEGRTDFGLAHEFVQENARAEDGSRLTQSFLRYDRKGLLVQQTVEVKSKGNPLP